MAHQIDLFSPIAHVPSPGGLTEPSLWVRRLAIYGDPQTLIRDVSFKPGLNVVWTPPLGDGDEPAMAHGAGKTTLCRLLRACLGEQAYAAESQRDLVVSHFPQGFVGAEIVVHGVCWASVYPFASRKGGYAVRADSIEAAMGGASQAATKASMDSVISNAFFRKFVHSPDPEIESEHVWDVVRAWLTRDQECRLAEPLVWRSPRTQTGSRAQTLSETSKLTMVRLALGALDDKEQVAAARERELEAAAKRRTDEHAYRERRYVDDLRAARQALGVSDDVGFADTLHQDGMVKLAQEALVKAESAEAPKSPDVDVLLAQLQRLNELHEALNNQQQQLSKNAEMQKEQAMRLRSEADIGQVDLAQGKIRVCPVCKVEIDEVLAKGCGISLEVCDLATIKDEISSKKRQAGIFEADARNTEREAKQLDKKIQDVLSQIEKMEEQASAASEARRASEGAVKQIGDRIYQAKRLLDDVLKLKAQQTALQAPPTAAPELERVRQQVQEGRARAQRSILMLSEQYQGIMADWLPQGMGGSITLDGNGLKVNPRFIDRGEVSSAALDSLKIVAFDLAALSMAIEGKADLPAFLLHDSPREADLDGALYSRLFELMLQWEKAADTPCFQYILTTTTAPPPMVDRDKHVILTMRSSPPEERLFRRDL